jgi:glutaredoxin 3
MLCPFCHRAKKLLKQKGAAFEEIDITWNASRRNEMLERADGHHTVPQIFIGDTHVGGFDDLDALEQAGDLDRLLDA